MVISRESDYAVRMMLALAQREPGSVMSSRALAEETEVPYELGRSVLNRLANAGLLVSLRGRTGGFKLARAANEVAVTEVMRVMGEDLSLNVCVADDRTCPRESFCPMHSVWLDASILLRRFLGEQTLAAVASRGVMSLPAISEESTLARPELFES